MSRGLKKWIPIGLTGGVTGYLTTKVALLRSHLLLAVFAAAALGLLAGLAEAAWRKVRQAN